MKIRSLLIIIYTIILAWLLPSFSRMLTSTSTSGRRLVCYSPINQHFCMVKNNNETNKTVRKDIVTNEEYTFNQFDSILPFLFYRQLLSDGKMPDTIQGRAICLKKVKEKRFYFRYSPKEKNSPKINLYPLFESASGRVDLKMPYDVFRLNNELTFLLPDKNSIDKEKTEKFRKTFQNKAFAFPAKQVFGNPLPRKPYDEGYFVIDANNDLFHFKMIKSKAFLKKIKLPQNCIPDYFLPYEPTDHSFYGFLFDKQGCVYVVNTNNYNFQKLNCDKVNLNNQYFVVIGNPFYWTVRIFSEDKEHIFAFNATDKKRIAQHTFVDTPQEKMTKYIFPFELNWKNHLSRFIKPKISFGNCYVWGVNFIFALLCFFLIARKKSIRTKISSILWVVLTGVFGFLSIIIFYKEN